MSSSIGSSINGQLSGRSRLQDRLAGRYENALGRFQSNIRAMSEQANARQLECLNELKANLAKSHSEVEDVLGTEVGRVRKHQEELEAYAAAMAEWQPGLVVAPFVDEFHVAAADRQARDRCDFTASTRKMEVERLRIVDIAVGLRRAYGARIAFLDACAAQLASEEQQRRTTVQQSLRELMLELAQISYRGVNTSHVLAQRVIHSTNEKLAENYLGARTLMCQLKSRELCKQRQYTNRLSALYASTLARMADSQLCWARTVLQSALFRRPVDRLGLVEEITTISAETRRRSTQFLDNLATVVLSLRVSREVSAEPVGSTQSLGGSWASGWLRDYDERVTNPVFAQSPEQVINEWRMKANVVVRNSLASCMAIIERTAASEKARTEAAETMSSGLLKATEWIYTPLESEADLFLEASLAADEDMDEPYKAFIFKNIALITVHQSREAQSLSPAVAQIGAECQWFVSQVRTGLAASHSFLERALLAAFHSVLRVFGQATEELVVTATNTLQFIRHFYRRQYEARRDHEDALAVLEEAYMQVGDQLTHAGSVAAGDELFAQGLAILDRIAQRYTDYHQSVVAETEAIKSDAAENGSVQCRQLQAKLGAESQAETAARLEQDRARRYREALLQAEQEAAAEKSKRKGGGGGGAGGAATGSRKRSSSMNDSRISSRAASISLSDFPIDAVQYEQITAIDGTVFNIVGPMQLLGDVGEEMTVPLAAGSAFDDPSAATAPAPGAAATTTGSATKAQSKRGPSGPGSPATAHSTTKRGRRRTSSTHEAVDATTAAASAQTDLVEVTSTFRETYQQLWLDTIALTENFLRQEDVVAWQRVLRVELLNWIVQLQRGAADELSTYVATTQTAIDKETNNLLRHHRRRPAVFQAEVYETRVRELDNDINASDKYCARLLERVNKVEGMWHSLQTNPDWLAEDGELLRQLDVLHEKAVEATSTAVLQVQERRHAGLCTQYLDTFAQRSRRVTESVEKQQETLALECQHYLADRAKQLAEDTFTGTADHETVLAQDSVGQRIRDILAQLHQTVEAVRAYVSKEQEKRQTTIATLRERYEVTYAQNSAELRLLASLQEIYGRLKAQVQSALMLSTAAETKLNTVIDLLEKELSKPVAKPSLASTMKILVQHDYSLETSKRPVVEELSADAEQQLCGDMARQTAAAQNNVQRQIRTSDLAEVLAILDSLRALLYVRGMALSTMLYSVVLYRVLPDNYILPKPLPREAEAQLAAAMNKAGKRGRGRGGVGTGGGGAGGTSSATTPVPAQDPLPVVPTIEGLLKEWIGEVKAEVLKVMQGHIGQYPPPLHRRLPNMRGGYPEDINQLTDSVCAVQENRLREHVSEAVRVFYQQVQRVYLAVQVMPSYMNASLYALTAAALETRVSALLTCFGDLYSYSSALKTVHKGLVKVSLSNQSQRAKLQQLTVAEDARQRVTEKALTRVWGLVLRELQDEAGLHAARCVNTVNSFFYLLKGLALPEHLLPSDGGEFAVGRHRGLRQLMKMRDKESRMKEQERSTAHKDRHLQETLPLLKQSKNTAKDSARRSVEGGGLAGGGAGGPLPQPANEEVDFTGLPLTGFQPLVPYNEEHPDDTVDPPLSARAYYLVPADLLGNSSTGGAAGATAGSSSAAGGAGAAGGKGRPKKNNAGAIADLGAGTESSLAGVSPPFVAPRTQVHQETVVLARECVELLNGAAQEVAEDVDKSFRSWTERERQWQDSWMLMVQTLNDASNTGQP